LDEHDATLAWRRLFQGQEITPDALTEAEAILEGMNGESPLHLRLANELKELRKLPQSVPSKGKKQRK
jgi:hypothetical protein